MKIGKLNFTCIKVVFICFGAFFFSNANSQIKLVDSRGTLRDTSTLLSGRVKYTDTSAMLSAYLRKGDTASISSRINLKLNISDTASMLNPYLRDADTTAMLSNYVNAATNGLTKSGKVVSLGGALTGATTITATASNTLSIAGLQSGTSTDSIVTINPSTNVLTKRTLTATIAEPWYKVGTTSGATSNTDDIFLNGKVGIGTTSPYNNLDVVGGLNIRNIAGNWGTGYGIELNSNSSSPRMDWVYNGAYIGQFSSDANNFILQNSKQATGGFTFLTSVSGTQTEKVRISNSGYVGIGTSSPTTILDVQASGSSNYTSVGKFLAPNNTTAGNATQMNFGAVMSAGNNAEWRFIYQGNNSTTNRVDFGFNGYNSPVLSYLVNGKVGVGNGSPTKTFDVVGTGKFSDTLYGTKAQFNALTTGASTDSIVTIDASGNLKKRNASLVVLDTTSLSNRINTKVNISDTAAMLSPYARKVNGVNRYITRWNGTNALDTTTMFEATNGNIGISTTSPSEKLDVAGNIRQSTYSYFSKNVGNTSAYIWSDYTYGNSDAFYHSFNFHAVGNSVFIPNSGYGTNTILQNNSGIFLNTSNGVNNVAPSTNVLSVMSTRKVGIGTVSPVGLLVVNDTSYISAIPSTTANLMDNTTYRPQSRFQVTSGVNNNALSNYFTTSTVATQAHNFSTGAVLPYVINPVGGNVGIGSTSPVSKLDIIQPSLYTGTETANHGLQITSAKTNTIGYTLYMGADSVNKLSYLQSVQWGVTYAPLVLNGRGGKVQIGTSSTAGSSVLEVNGAATNATAYNAAAATSIDFTKSNLAYTTASAGAFTLTGMKDGGTYTLAVQGATSGTSSFSGSNPSSTAFTFKPANNGVTTASKHTLYTFMVMGTTVYYYMVTGL